MNAMERLNSLVKEKGPLLAGLDPDLEKVIALNAKTGEIPIIKNNIEEYKRAVMRKFCTKYIDAVKDVAAAIKINIAFFEACDMVDLFWKAALIAKKNGLFVIGDVKRGDIGNTAKQYAKAYLSAGSPLDAITINPYFGTDGVMPFVEMAKENDKAVFVLLKTSNKSATEIQDIEMACSRKKFVYEEVARLIDVWGNKVAENDELYSIVGAVVGATYPDDAWELRESMPNTFFLVPGYGTQGASASDVAFCFDGDQGGAIVNSSRGLMFAYEKKPWKDKFAPLDWDKATKGAATVAVTELKEAVKAAIEDD